MDGAARAAPNEPLPDTGAEARRVTDAAREQGVTAELLGGAAIALRSPSAGKPPLQREYKDIDLVTSKAMVSHLTALLESAGYAPDKRFNALHGGQRLFFWDQRNERQLDVFVDRFEMCHALDLRRRLAVDPTAPTLPLADLLLTKLQIFEINFKDLQDIAALLQDHPLTADDQGINVPYITDLTRQDWGLQHTLERSLSRLTEKEANGSLRASDPQYDLTAQVDALRQAMTDAPKSTGWKLRAKVGERMRWYELPEEARG